MKRTSTRDKVRSDSTKPEVFSENTSSWRVSSKELRHTWQNYPLDAPSLRTPHNTGESHQGNNEVFKSSVENTSRWRVSWWTFPTIQPNFELFFAETTSQWNVSLRQRPQENVLSCTGSQNDRTNDRNENDTASSNWKATKTIDIINQFKIKVDQPINSALKLSQIRLG